MRRWSRQFQGRMCTTAVSGWTGAIAIACAVVLGAAAGVVYERVTAPPPHEGPASLAAEEHFAALRSHLKPGANDRTEPADRSRAQQQRPPRAAHGQRPAHQGEVIGWNPWGGRIVRSTAPGATTEERIISHGVPGDVCFWFAATYRRSDDRLALHINGEPIAHDRAPMAAQRACRARRNQLELRSSPP